jgi:hypothetical protein
MGAPVLASVSVLPAVMAVLTADATLVALVAAPPAGYGASGIYDTLPPQTAARPHLHVSADGEISFDTMGGQSDDKWGGIVSLGLKAVVNTSPTVGLQIISRAKVLLDGAEIAVSGFGSVICAWENLHATYAELIGGQPVWHVPASMTITVHQLQP